MTPEEIEFPHLKKGPGKEFLVSLLRTNWPVKDLDLAIACLQNHFPSKGTDPLPLIWDGLGPVEKALLEELLDRCPQFYLKGYLDAPYPAIHPDLATSTCDGIILADERNSRSLEEALIQSRVPSEKIYRPFRDPSYLSSLDTAWQERKKRFLSSAAAAAKGKKQVLFIVMQRGSFPSVEFFAESLKAYDSLCLTALYFFNPPPRDLYHKAFYCCGSFQILSEVIREIHPDLVYVQSHFKWTFLSQLVSALTPGRPVIHEVNDWMTAFIETREAEEAAVRSGLWPAEEISLIQDCETYIFTQTQGVIHKDGGEWITAKTEAAGAKALHLLPCQPAGWMRPPEKNRRQADETWRLVFAGKIAPSHASEAFFGDIKLLFLARRLTGQGLELTLYNSPVFNQAQIDRDFSDYLEEADHNPLFRFQRGVDINHIADCMNGCFHFGLMLYDFGPDLKIGRRHLSGSMATKLFTYISAGLPILISPELTYMAEFVRENRIGLVIDAQGGNSLKHTLDSVDHDSLLEHIAIAQKTYTAEKNAAKLMTFLTKAMTPI